MPYRLARLDRLARFVGTEVFSPFVLVGILLVAIPLASTEHWLWQAAVGLVSVVAIPLALSLWFARTGRTTDKFIYHRHQRHLFYGISLVSVGAGTLTLLLTPSAPEVKALLLAMLAAIVVIALVNLRLKASAHAGMSAVFAVLVPGLFGPWWLLLTVPVHVTVWWSRWVQRRHTTAELVVGTVIGVAIGVGYLALV
ncbi:hypothetical protein NBM05_12310 [Rothia sp. AR01]|uniref:Phosphoesterase PA-phosphatase n=1 Tax=Rothia santali TaxID=2949643 RepID=A0A9X2HLZ6_9MICC|nr:hypothetical protein [Rothia santali]MCP3426763.1 hypothetical protein [Rothia santali]